MKYVSAPGIALMLVVIAQPAISQHMLTLERSLQLAEENSPAMRSALHATRIASLSQSALEVANLPVIGVAGVLLYAPTTALAGYDPAITDGGQVSAQLQAKDVLFDGGARGIKLDQAAIDITRLTREQLRTLRDLRASVKGAFVETLRARDEVGLQEHRVQDLTEYLALVTRLSRAGTNPSTDVSQTQVDVGQARVDLQRARQTFLTSRYALTGAMGIVPDTAWTVEGSIDHPGFLEVDSTGNTRLDSTTNLDLHIAALEIRQTALEVDLARRGRYPVVSLFADAGILTSFDNLRLPRAERFSGLGYSLGISIENLLFDWGTTSMRIEMKQIDAENRQNEYTRVQRSLEGEVKSLRVQISGLRSQLGFIRTLSRVAEDNALLTKAQYAGGGSSARDVLTSQRMLFDVRLSQLNATAEVQKLLARYEVFFTY